ncbi:TRAP transporter small permease [Ahrensia sp. R2A130]|uniref:TRAP transporter small permease n=1 Tax=Ahrensia sp. R2A130 TaxID=744979 RepID=UPI0001E0A4D4|nr:TRAP transporter small permease [Ahrensia sp. R2A130]EFL88438.1 tripartite ATP-independent periplasmic transporter DctQ [Ahrensia sp. R2A130]
MMGILTIFAGFNSVVLRITRQLAWIALALMVVVILLQVVFRYVFNSALPWPDEAARFLMLWMTGLIAPSAYRWGGFVAIDMIPQMMPTRVAQILMLVLTLAATAVLCVAISFGWNHTFGFGGNFDSSSLRIPLDWVGGESIKVKLRYMYGAFFLGLVMLLVINIELILRQIILFFDPDAELPDDGSADFLAETGQIEAAGGAARID